MNTETSFKENIHSINDQNRYHFDPDIVPDWFQKAAVLVLFFEEAGIIRVILTERSENLKSHRGEVCFPGGRVEAEESLIQAALRETEEEIGIDSSKVNIIGRLDDAWSRAAYHMIPFVGWYEGVPELTPNAGEVGKILKPDIRELLDESNREQMTVEREGLVSTINVIHYQGSRIFGLTADILLEALERGKGIQLSRGKKRAETLQSALANRFFAYQKSNGRIHPQTDRNSHIEASD